MVYDITCGSSFDNLMEKWICKALDLYDDSVIVLVGNKCDLEEQREVSTDKAMECASKCKVLHISENL